MSVSNLGIISYQFKEIFKFLNFVVGFVLFLAYYILFQILSDASGLLVLISLVYLLVSVCVMLSVDAVIYRELVLSEDKVEEAKPEEAL